MPSSKPDPAVLAEQLAAERPPPPVDRWNPPLSGDMDLRIARNGTWYHEGTAFQREALVRLFASILRRDEDGYHYLVTPVEKWRIQVEDAPFVAIRVDATGVGSSQVLTFTTNVGDTLTAGPDHPLVVEYRKPGGEPSPYLHVRGRLRALLSRAVFVELTELGEERNTSEGRCYGVWSRGEFFALGRLDEES
ncbi:MAG: DUF1285 domain-containing protein [Candidatus Competibacteraceae bacterium]|nr:DUF1285 domain-containing protein [Candidatus Competibacteraceae bacterium]MBK8898419.1 DUF1285 domain-containing protein [Candidatus Competibacteraceae bacterium]MBK8962230.1 DUF1285 domain-containing protein [Candidatus Competibacteraceae bacterium]